MEKTTGSIRDMHMVITMYNALVIFVLTAFIAITQQKINISMSAHSFLSSVPVLPLPASLSIYEALISFSLLVLSGYWYRSENNKSRHGRVLAFIFEVIMCLLLLHSTDLLYDGVVLLAVSDLMYRYEGSNHGIILFIAMTCLYFVADYNISSLQLEIVPFSAYAAYYNISVQNVLFALKNALVSFNVILFVMYMMLLVQTKHQEKERIAALNKQLNDANDQLKLYAREAERMAETRERNRLAREIHDTLGHALTGIVAGLDACIMTIDTAPDFTRKQLKKIRETALRGITDVRRSVKKLRPDDLEQLPLKEALIKMINDFADSSGMQINLSLRGWPTSLREDESEVIYRIVQESVTNANRHGKAKHVNITITGENNRLRLIIADDGCGCAKIKSGFGLRHMHERVELLKGSMDYWSDEGFILEVTLPMKEGTITDD